MLAHEPWECCFDFQIWSYLRLRLVSRFLCAFLPNTDSSGPPFCPSVGIYKGMRVWHCEGHSFQNNHIAYNNSHTSSSKTQANLDSDKVPLSTSIPRTSIPRVIFYSTIEWPWSYIASLPTTYQSNQRTLNMQSSGVITRGDGWYCVSYHTSSSISTLRF